jgi:hypothetical protein
MKKMEFLLSKVPLKRWVLQKIKSTIYNKIKLGFSF